MGNKLLLAIAAAAGAPLYFLLIITPPPLNTASQAPILFFNLLCSLLYCFNLLLIFFYSFGSGPDYPPWPGARVRVTHIWVRSPGVTGPSGGSRSLSLSSIVVCLFNKYIFCIPPPTFSFPSFPTLFFLPKGGHTSALNLSSSS